MVAGLFMVGFGLIGGLTGLYYRGQAKADAKRYLDLWQLHKDIVDTLQRRTAICLRLQGQVNEATRSLYERDQRIRELEAKSAEETAGR